jgi:hypothetical protein
MNALTREDLMSRMVSARIKPRLRRSIRFVPEEITDWDSRDFLAVTDRSRQEGVLVFDDYTVAFDLSNRKPNANGRAEAIICDICATWQRGTHSAVVTFQKGDKATVSHLVCADLDCSLHVRGLTTAGKFSRTQIREDITPEGRIERLKRRLDDILSNLSA